MDVTVEGFKYPKPELVDQSTESKRNISCSGYFLFSIFKPTTAIVNETSSVIG
jgi:hypothetical protein